MNRMSLSTFDVSSKLWVTSNGSKLTPQAGEIKDVKQLNLRLQKSEKKDEKSNDREVYT